MLRMLKFRLGSRSSWRSTWRRNPLRNLNMEKPPPAEKIPWSENSCGEGESGEGSMMYACLVRALPSSIYGHCQSHDTGLRDLWSGSMDVLVKLGFWQGAPEERSAAALLSSPAADPCGRAVSKCSTFTWLAQCSVLLCPFLYSVRFLPNVCMNYLLKCRCLFFFSFNKNLLVHMVFENEGRYIDPLDLAVMKQEKKKKLLFYFWKLWVPSAGFNGTLHNETKLLNAC